jgi:hypothetical protein
MVRVAALVVFGVLGRDKPFSRAKARYNLRAKIQIIIESAKEKAGKSHFS